MRTIPGRIGPLGITINNVAPGVLDSPIGASLNVDTEKMKPLLSEMPIHRMGKPHQVAQLSVFPGCGRRRVQRRFTYVIDGYMISESESL